jgi:hypothetical protein
MLQHVISKCFKCEKFPEETERKTGFNSERELQAMLTLKKGLIRCVLSGVVCEISHFVHKHYSPR